MGNSINLISKYSNFINAMPVQDDRSLENSASTSSDDSFETTINMVKTSTLESIQNELDTFEKRLLCEYSTLDTLPETELKLPMLFIDNFSRIFRLWHENPVFKNSVSSKQFYDIFSLMFRSLNDQAAKEEQPKDSQDDARLSDLTGICDICDEEFEIIDNDAKKSYAEHERGEEHIKLLNTFNQIGTLDRKEDDIKHVDVKPVVARAPSLINPAIKFTSRSLNVFKANECFLEVRDGNPFNIECCLCDKICQNQGELIEHCNSKIHKKRVLYFFCRPQLSSNKQVQFNDDLIYTKGNYIYCVLCQYVLPKHMQKQHVAEEDHNRWKNFARKILNIEEPYFRVISQASEMAFCALCCKRFPLDYGIVPHCQTKNHILYKHFADEILTLYLNGPSMK